MGKFSRSILNSAVTRRGCALLLICACVLPGTTTHADPALVDWNESTRFDDWYVQGSAARLQRWKDIIVSGQHLDEAEKLRLANDFFNGARFVSDEELYGVADYWATPTEFIEHDAGDCEDFAIAKYFTLKAMGMDVAKLRITYVKSLTLNQAHMVLAYYPTPDAEPLILDNLNLLIKPASERADLRPVYSFNAEALWLSRTRNEQIKTGSPSQLEQWRQMVARLDSELR
ncbi:MAG: sulfate adenylyltransferase [Porticoccaceae bacterium]|nr:transglutaminase-like cysteine peptidase [Gammaproteobacteria bacterium]TAL07019.1 MAG: sulfate adenylyltransferase [Porticoccaceae bacterium]